MAAISKSLQHKCSMIPLNEEAFRWGIRAVKEKITELA